MENGTILVEMMDEKVAVVLKVGLLVGWLVGDVKGCREGGFVDGW
jgi:hypothetical protein